MKINYNELAEKLIKILDYESRPINICEELLNEYGRYYNGIVYHGAFGHTNENVINNYSGIISCTYDLDIAETFAQSFIDENIAHTIIEIKLDNVFALDVQYLIESCYKQCPDNELCTYMYDGYNSENELLLYFDDIKNNITFLK